MNTQTKYIIKDWVNNTCFKGTEFESFEDAWSFIYENDPCTEEQSESGYYDDYYVEELI